jgi:hypothetical protein
VDLDDDKLQELKMIWGQDAHDAVVIALVKVLTSMSNVQEREP